MTCFIPTNIKFDDCLAHCPCAVNTGDCFQRERLDCTGIYSDCDISQNYKVIISSFSKDTSLDNPSSKRSLKNGSIYGINTISDLFINIEGIIYGNTCEDMKSAENFLNKVWKLGTLRDFTNRGFFRLEWEECGEVYWCIAQMYESLPIVESEEGQCFKKEFSVRLVVKDARIYKGIDLVMGDVVNENWGCKQNNCCDDEGSSTAKPCQSNFLSPAKLTITFNSDSDLLEAPHINPVTGVSNYIEPTILTDFIIVKNETTDQIMRVNVNMRKNDILCIDGFSGKIFLNGIEQINVTDPFLSEFPAVTGIDEWLLMDSTHPGTHGEQLSMQIEYYQIA